MTGQEEQILIWAADMALSSSRACIVVRDLDHAARARSWLAGQFPGSWVQCGGMLMIGEARIHWRTAKAHPDCALLWHRGVIAILPGALEGQPEWRAARWRDLATRANAGQPPLRAQT